MYVYVVYEMLFVSQKLKPDDQTLRNNQEERRLQAFRGGSLTVRSVRYPFCGQLRFLPFFENSQFPLHGTICELCT